MEPYRAVRDRIEQGNARNPGICQCRANAKIGARAKATQDELPGVSGSLEMVHCSTNVLNGDLLEVRRASRRTVSKT
jgi:hypothetical protein